MVVVLILELQKSVLNIQISMQHTHFLNHLPAFSIHACTAVMIN